jgi:hypothetical protein
MAKVNAYERGAPGEPSFPSDIDILEEAVLQKADLENNRDEYYAAGIPDAEVVPEALAVAPLGARRPTGTSPEAHPFALPPREEPCWSR